jgi:hypothetical protein
MKDNLFFLVLLCFSTKMFSQNAEYIRLITLANQHYENKDYQKSADTYSAAFISLGNKGQMSDRYNAACSWALVGNSDSAFFQLNRITERMNYANYKEVTEDVDLNPLHSDNRWTTLIAQIKANYDKEYSFSDKPLYQTLDSMKVHDQKWRNLAVQTRNKETNAIPLDSIHKMMGLVDSMNYFILKNIIEKKGFPNYDMVGKQGSNNFWLLVQHQDAHPEFQQDVLKLMKIEVDKEKASASNYAYLMDRVMLNTNQLQIYGTQMQMNAERTSYEPRPLKEPEKVNERRMSVGLGSIEDYIETMNRRNYGSLKK